MARYGFMAAALAAGVAAQSAAPFTDAATGITFAAFNDAITGTQVGIALPETFTGDFIGQLSAPTGNSTGWVGMSLGAGMVNNLLVAAWVDEGELVSSFRKADGYVAPAAFPSANFTASPIATGTFVNSSHYSYTFLCSGCLSVQPNFQAAGTTGTGVGWALSTTELAATSPADEVALNFHNAGQGIFSLSFADAQSASFAEWAALAGSSNGTTPTNPGGASTTFTFDPATPPTDAPTETETGSEPTATDSDPTATATDSEPTITAAPTGALPTTTRRGRTTRSPRTTRTRSTRTRATRTRSTRTRRPSSTGRAQARPFRPAFNPDAVNGDDYAESQRFKASFLDKYYKAGGD